MFDTEIAGLTMPMARVVDARVCELVELDNRENQCLGLLGAVSTEQASRQESVVPRRPSDRSCSYA